MMIVVLIAVQWVLAGGMDFEMEFQREDLEFYMYDGYLRMQLPGCCDLAEPGQPLLPVRTVVLVVPACAREVSVSVEATDVAVLEARTTVQPCPVPRPFSDCGAPQRVVPDPLVYGTAGFWPSTRVSAVHAGARSGYRLVSFQVRPVRYDPVGGLLELAGSIRAHVSWTEGTAPFLSQEQTGPAMDQIRSWIDNPQDLWACSPPASGSEAGVDMVVITTDDYSDSFSMLVDYRNSQGIVTELVDVDSVIANTSGWDDAEKLRNYIIERYQNDGLQYVLLGGDQTAVPVRMVNLYCEGYSDNVPVDLYFSDLDGTWDASGDHDYGQPDDDLDLYSDVAVGRALVGSQDQAALFVERTIEYQQNPPSGEWRTTAMLCGAGLFTGYTGAKVCDSIAVNLPGEWTVYKAYEEAKSSDGFTTHIDVINDGTNWVHYAGHGSTTGIYWQGYPSSMMTNSIASALTNGSMAGVHHSIACMPGAFHSGECCAEALLHNPAGGASSVMFNTSYGWEGNIPEMGVSEWMCVYLTEEVFQLGNTMIGQAFATAKDRRVPLWSGGFDRELYCIHDWHAFHDPAMPVLGSSTGIADSPSSVAIGAPVTIGPPVPNPSCGSVSFQVGLSSADARIRVYDISGRMVWDRFVQEACVVSWDYGSSLAPGVYFAMAGSGGFSDSVRFLVVR